MRYILKFTELIPQDQTTAIGPEQYQQYQIEFSKLLTRRVPTPFIQGSEPAGLQAVADTPRNVATEEPDDEARFFAPWRVRKCL